MLTDAIRELREMQASFLSAYAATLGGQAERKERDLLDSLGIATPHSPSRRKGAAGSKANPLTERELEVARLVAEGDSNRRIAEKLFLSERTIESHLGNIFGKINVSSRAGLLRWVIERRGSN
jgi:DNA-binding NarL/FixJ family response regulator